MIRHSRGFSFDRLPELILIAELIITTEVRDNVYLIERDCKVVRLDCFALFLTKCSFSRPTEAWDEKGEKACALKEFKLASVG